MSLLFSYNIPKKMYKKQILLIFVMNRNILLIPIRYNLEYELRRNMTKYLINFKYKSNKWI